MKQVLRRLPFFEMPTTVDVAGQSVAVRAYQIIVWVSLSNEDLLASDAPRFPAILDVGHSHNFSIQESQLERWADIPSARLASRGSIYVNRRLVPLYTASVWVHRNRPGTLEVLPKPIRLHLPEGISVYPDGAPDAPRLPLLGLRGLMRNKLRLVIARMSVSLQEEA